VAMFAVASAWIGARHETAPVRADCRKNATRPPVSRHRFTGWDLEQVTPPDGNRIRQPGCTDRRIAAMRRAALDRAIPCTASRRPAHPRTLNFPDGFPTAKAPPVVTVRPADSSARASGVLDWLLGRLPPRYREKARDYLVLTRMDRPIGALLLLWPTWWALWLAAGDWPPFKPLAIFTLGVFAMRAAGCAINDYADRKLDPLVERTAGRPIASGRVTPREALIVFGALLAFAFVLVLFTNALTIKLSFAGAALAAVYPFTKRWTYLPQVVLGAAFGWSIPMAFAAVAGTVPPVGWLLFIGNILWSVIYDTEYAMVDRDDDIKANA